MQRASAIVTIRRRSRQDKYGSVDSLADFTDGIRSLQFLIREPSRRDSSLIMDAVSSIFFDIELPNATTWFYFSALLAVALFFKFNRLLSIRNSDVLSLFLPMPGFLLLGQKSISPFWGYLWLLAASGYYLLRCLFDLTLVRRPILSPNLNFGGLVWLAGALFISLIAVAARHPNTQSPYSPQNGEGSAHIPSQSGGGRVGAKPRETAPGAIEPMRKQVEKVIREQAPAEV